MHKNTFSLKKCVYGLDVIQEINIVTHWVNIITTMLLSAYYFHTRIHTKSTCNSLGISGMERMKIKFQYKTTFSSFP